MTFGKVKRKMNYDTNRESRKQNRNKKVGMVNVYENGKIYNVKKKDSFNLISYPLFFYVKINGVVISFF
jgi:hypothetical protein